MLAAMGWSLLSQGEPAPVRAENGVVAGPDMSSLDGKAFYPLTFPLTAGPGCIVVMITLGAQASAQRGFSDLTAHGGIALAVVALSGAVFICYGFAPAIAARIKPQTAHGIQRVIAFVLLSIGCRLRGTVRRCSSRRFPVDSPLVLVTLGVASRTHG